MQGRVPELLTKKLSQEGFEDISMVVLAPSIANFSKVRDQILHFLGDYQVGVLLKVGSEMEHRVKLYVSREFIRYSATYVDVDTDKGIIRIAFPMYGLLLENSPITILTPKQSLDVYNCFIQSWGNFRKRLGTPITTPQYLREFRKQLRL